MTVGLSSHVVFSFVAMSLSLSLSLSLSGDLVAQSAPEQVARIPCDCSGQLSLLSSTVCEIN